MTSQSDHGMLGGGCEGLPAWYIMDMGRALIDSDKGITVCEVTDIATGDKLSCRRLDKLKLQGPQAVIKLQRVRHCVSSIPLFQRSAGPNYIIKLL